VKKLKYYVLTTKNFNQLKRHISKEYSNIPKKDLVVVINTLDEDYLVHAKGYCVHNDIEYYVTESDGTPAKGKNSVLDIFSKSDNDYMVLIDGDDYLTPHGVWVYNHLSKQEDAPDAVCLWAQKGYQRTGIDDDSPVVKSNPFCLDYRKMIYFDWPKFFREQGKHSSQDSERFGEDMLEFWRYQYKYSEPYTQNCRVTFMSKKAAESRYPEGIMIGEDTLQFFLLKDRQHSGDLNMFKSIEEPPTYIYDQSLLDGVVVTESELGLNPSWVSGYLEIGREYEEMGVVHENYELPELKVEYPSGYVADTCGFGNFGALYDITNNQTEEVIRQFWFPANANETSLIAENERIRELYSEEM